MLSTDEKYMARCLHLAQFGGGYVSPNPMVGAVLVCNDRIIGEGYHRRIGEAHAEPNAIASVTDKDLLQQSILIITNQTKKDSNRLKIFPAEDSIC